MEVSKPDQTESENEPEFESEEEAHEIAKTYIHDKDNLALLAQIIQHKTGLSSRVI